jgi:cytochrome P450
MDPSLTDEDLLDDFTTFFFAGQETTANALSFMFSEVGRKPDVVQR